MYFTFFFNFKRKCINYRLKGNSLEYTILNFLSQKSLKVENDQNRLKMQMTLILKIYKYKSIKIIKFSKFL